MLLNATDILEKTIKKHTREAFLYELLGPNSKFEV